MESFTDIKINDFINWRSGNGISWNHTNNSCFKHLWHSWLGFLFVCYFNQPECNYLKTHWNRYRIICGNYFSLLLSLLLRRKKKECKATLSRYTKIIKRKVFLFSLKNSNCDQFCSDGTTQLGDCEWFAHPSLFYFFQRLSDVPIRHTFLICVWWYPTFINSSIFWHDLNLDTQLGKPQLFVQKWKHLKIA